MPYPFTFRPNTTCNLYDRFGTHVASSPIQIFKPLLGCTFNTSNSPIQFLIPSGGCILRGLVQYNIGDLEMSDLGPETWDTASAPRFKLDEDPTGWSWYITDGVPWQYDGDLFLLSFFASKRQDVVNPGAGGVDLVPPFEENESFPAVWAPTANPMTDPPIATDFFGQRLWSWDSKGWTSSFATDGGIWIRISLDTFNGMGGDWRRNTIISWQDANAQTWWYRIRWWDFINVGGVQIVSSQCDQINEDRTQPPAYR